MTYDKPFIRPPGGVLSGRRLALLAAAAGAGAVALVAGSQGSFSPLAFSAAAHAAEAGQHPAGFADLVEKVKPAVISVRVKVQGGAEAMGFDESEDDHGAAPGSPGERFFRRFGFPDGMTPEQPRRRDFTMGQGSGFFISADGYAVTNNHVVAKAESVEVITDEGKTFAAKVIGTDPRTDLALIKIDGRDDFPFVKLAASPPRIGDWVVAVGNPFGLGGTVTAGVVSARGRDIGAGPYDDFVQIDAPMNKGNSGGPTFNVDGNVIGVNTAIFAPSGGSVGIAFAIPSDTVKTVVAQLKDKGVVTRGWLGVQIQPVTADIAEGLALKSAEGALVAEPLAGGPAAKSGIMAGDVIAKMNGLPVKDARDLARKIGSMEPGSTVTLVVLRKGEEKTIGMTLGELPNDLRHAGAEQQDKTADNAPRIGLTLAPAREVAGAGSEGVVVTAVSPDGPAAERGFEPGDVILDVGGKAVATPADVRSALAEARKASKHTVLMRVKSAQGTKFVAVPISHA